MYPRLRTLTPAQANLRALLLGSALALVCSTAVATVVMNRDPEVDDKGCVVGQPPPRTIALVLDGTTALTPSQAAQAKAVIRQARDRLPRFGRIILLRLDPAHPYEPEEKLSVCNPGAPGQLSFMFHTPSKVQARWRESLETPLDRAVSEITRPREEDWSPVLETITGTTWRPDFGPSIPNRELVLVSDLRQNTKDLSFYRPGRPASRVAASQAGRMAQANLRGAEVRLEVLHRPDPGPAEASLLGFWRAWLTSRGAGRVLADGVELKASEVEQ